MNLPSGSNSNSDLGQDLGHLLTWTPQMAALALGLALLQFRAGRRDEAATEDLDRAEDLIEMVAEWLRRQTP